MKINGDVSAVTFSHDGGKIFAHSGEWCLLLWSQTSFLFDRVCACVQTRGTCTCGTRAAAAASTRSQTTAASAGRRSRRPRTGGTWRAGRPRPPPAA